MHRRHAHIDGDLLEFDVTNRSRRIEPGMNDQLRAHAEPEQHDNDERIDVEHRQDAEKALLALA